MSDEEAEMEYDEDETHDEESSEEIVDELPYNFKEETPFNKEIIIVKRENMITSHKLSLFEMTELVSIRTMEIAANNQCFVDVSDLSDPELMAKRELMARKSPLICKRYVGDKRVDGIVHSYYEYWDVNTMVFPVVYT